MRARRFGVLTYDIDVIPGRARTVDTSAAGRKAQNKSQRQQQAGNGKSLLHCGHSIMVSDLDKGAQLFGRHFGCQVALWHAQHLKTDQVFPDGSGTQ